MMKTNSSNERWFNPGISSGWHKSDPAHLRRYRALRAHKGNKLSTARALQALSNVSTDKTTRKLAGTDAQYFFDLYKKEKEK